MKNKIIEIDFYELCEQYEKNLNIKLRDFGSDYEYLKFWVPDTDLKKRFGDAFPYVSKLKTIAEEANLTLAELSLLWLINLKEVSKVVIGVDNADQLNSHLGALEKKVDPTVFEEALAIEYENEQIFNPSLWK